jgi:hypothetical protein
MLGAGWTPIDPWHERVAEVLTEAEGQWAA